MIIRAESSTDVDKNYLNWELRPYRYVRDYPLGLNQIQSSEKNRLEWQLNFKSIKKDNGEYLEAILMLLSSSNAVEIEILQIVFAVKTFGLIRCILGECKLNNIKLKVGGNVLLLSQPTAGMNLDFLIVSCSIEYTINIISQASNNVKEIPANISADLKSLLKDNAFSDVKLISQCKEFQVHKMILSARSPVFSAMFQHDMKEQLTNEVFIDDVAPEALEEMINFIYSDEVTNVSGDLLMLAEKYDIKVLKAKCDHALVETLTIENAIEMLNLSHQYNAEYLKYHALIFIKKFANDVVKTSAFKNLEDSKAKIILELFLSD